MKPARALAHPFRFTTGAQRLSIVVASTALLVGVLPMAPAQAEPTLTQAQQQVQALDDKLQLANEEYNGAQIALAESRKKVAALEPQAKVYAAKLAEYQKKISSIATMAYTSGRIDVYTALFSSGSPQDFLDQSALLEQITLKQRAEIAGFLESKKKFDDAKSKVDGELAKQLANEKVLRDRRSAINKDLVNWQTLSAKLGGGNSDDVVVPPYNGPASGAALVAINYALAQARAVHYYALNAAGPKFFDCSGLTMAAYLRAGIRMPHSARGQFAMFPKVQLSDLRPGDLVMFGRPIQHVALYVGNGLVVHAPTFGQRVKVVPLNRAGRVIAGAVRPS